MENFSSAIVALIRATVVRGACGVVTHRRVPLGHFVRLATASARSERLVFPDLLTSFSARYEP